MDFNVTDDDLIEAGAFFTDDLRGGEWEKLSESAQKGALKLARMDVAGILRSDSLDLENPTIAGAVYEQAIHLVIARNHSQERPILSERIDGLGERTYASCDSSATMSAISSRTMLLLQPLLQRQINLNRG